MTTHTPTETTVVDGDLTVTGRLVLRAEGQVVRYSIRNMAGPDIWTDVSRSVAVEIVESLPGYSIVGARGLVRAATPRTSYVEVDDLLVGDALVGSLATMRVVEIVAGPYGDSVFVKLARLDDESVTTTREFRLGSKVEVVR